MKKNLFLAVLAIASLAACTSNDELVENVSKQDGNVPLRFQTSYIGNSKTRATGDVMDLAALANKEIALWGAPYNTTTGMIANSWIPGEKLVHSTSAPHSDEGTGNNCFWTLYNGDKYWTSSSTYTFAALMPYELKTYDMVTYSDEDGNTLSKYDRKFTINSIPTYATVANANDILVSDAVDGKVGGSSEPVELTFRHILSRLSVYAYSCEDPEAVNKVFEDNSELNYHVAFKKISIWLPKADKYSATYKQKNHSGPVNKGDDKDTWEMYTTAASPEHVATAPNITKTGDEAEYEEVVIYQKSGALTEAPFYKNYVDAETATKLETTAYGLDPFPTEYQQHFLCAPTPTDIEGGVTYYLSCEYEIHEKDTEKKIAEFTTEKMRIEDLVLKQNYQTNLFIEVSAGDIEKLNIVVKSVEGYDTETQANKQDGDLVEYVDLGLPSGTLWARYDIGGNPSEKYPKSAYRFMWGDVNNIFTDITNRQLTYEETYERINFSNYLDGQMSSINDFGTEKDLLKEFASGGSRYSMATQAGEKDGIGGTEFDAANKIWGKRWRLPTKAEIEELKNNTTVSKFINGDDEYTVFTSKKYPERKIMFYVRFRMDKTYPAYTYRILSSHREATKRIFII